MQKVLVLHDFMLKDRKLSGTKLLVYALIYSYGQIPDSCFVVKWQNVIKFLGISKSSYFDALKWLIDNKYICDHFKILDSSHAHHEFGDLTLMNGKYYTNEEISKIAQYKWVK